MTSNFPIKLLAFATFCVAGLAVGQVPAQAATWHTGTPKALRGMYQAHRENQAEGFGPVLKLTAKSVSRQNSNWPLIKITHVKYKRLKHNAYLIKGHMQKNGYVLSRPASVYIARKGNRLLTIMDPDFPGSTRKTFHADYRYALRNPFVKTHKVKANGPVIHV